MKVKNIKFNAAKNTHRVVAELLFEEKDCKTALDIPCGAGAFAGMLSGSGITVYSADCENLFEIRDGHFDIADMTKPFPYRDGQFDAVVSIDGIEHIENPFDFIRECRRVLRPGGVCIISTPNISSFRSRARWLWTGFHNKNKTPLDETKPNPLHHINMISFPELRYMLHSNGFKILKIATREAEVAAETQLSDFETDVFNSADVRGNDDCKGGSQINRFYVKESCFAIYEEIFTKKKQIGREQWKR